jgi:AraC-like DNA-binding protein
MVNYLLAAVIALPVFAMLFNLSLYYHTVYFYPIFFYICFPMGYLWAPSFYWYVMKIIGKNLHLRLIDVVHFIPSFASIMVSIWFSLQSSHYKTLFFDQIYSNPPIQLRVMNLFLTAQIFAYCIISIKKVNAFEKLIRSIFSDIQHISAQWIKQFVYLYIALNILVIVPTLILPKISAFVIYIPLSMLISFVYLVYNSVAHDELFKLKIVDKLYEKSRLGNIVDTEIAITGLQETMLVSNEYQNPLLSNIEMEETDAKLKKVLESSYCYLEGSLAIRKLSELTNIPVHKLSELINRKHGMNFYDFINSYRVEHAKSLLLDSVNNKYTIEAIAKMSGFKNRSTFYTAFGKITGTSPKEFKLSQVS